MNKTIRIFFLSLICFASGALSSYGGPVKSTDTIYTQPDGTFFKVKVKGDEWSRIRTTADGCAITRDSDGWWCYGVYDSNGVLSNTGCKVGKEVSPDILASSRLIPYSQIAAKASERKAAVNGKRMSALRATRNMSKVETRSGTVPQVKRGIAILAQFQDVTFTYTKEDFRRMLNEAGYNGTGSAKDYYEDQFGDGWEFIFDVSEIVTLPKNRKYYGENTPDEDGTDIRPATMAWHACKAADKDVDFSLYDQDGDGEVENVYIFYAGHDESENTDQTDLLWAHQYYVFSGSESIQGYGSLDGVYVDRYACSSELSGRKDLTGIGTFCHEYAHTFGLPDFYDTDYEDGGWAAGLWKKTSLMDGGNYNNDSATPPNFNCIERKLLGLSEPVEIEAGRSYTLEPVHKAGSSYMVSSGVAGEYFLFECRSNEGWDKYIGGIGMLAYHINENGRGLFEGSGMVNCWDYNIVNAAPSNQCADLLEADGRSDSVTDFTDFNNIKGIFYPQTGVNSISPQASKSYTFSNGTAPDISLIGISFNDNTVSFHTTGSDDIPEVPEVSRFHFTSYPDAILLEFQAKNSLSSDKAVVKWRKKDQQTQNAVSLSPNPDGTYSHMLEGLASGNVLYEIEIYLETDGIPGETYKTQIMTKRSPEVIWPYLYVDNGGKIIRDEGFVAHAVNTSDAVEKSWYLDDTPLTLKNGCRIFPEKNGTLSCVITWKDGSTDTIVKEITITE